jgi:Na+/H+ antiporter NhaD/arsenite permease-like protein
MFVAMIVVFILGYTLIALEHPIKVNKSATALILGTVLWVMLMLGGIQVLVDTGNLKHYLEDYVGGSFADWVSHYELLHHLGEISEILFFLLGAMTIVELVDSYEGFRIITDKIKTTKRSKLLWVTSILTFFMSAALDNLTTSIVMVALLRKLIEDKKDRWFFAGMVIVAANAGGAWSPIGDITTIMLWIAGKVSTVNIIIMTILPSMVSMIIPLVILSFTMKGNVKRPNDMDAENGVVIPQWESRLLFFMGVSGLLFVPVFKNFTHLPPYLGMLFSLGVLWATTEILHARRIADPNRPTAKHLTIVGVLQKVDVPSVLFFLGILTAVAALDTTGHLDLLAAVLNEHVGNLYVINIIIGALSAIVDNVPLVAGAMNMYNFPQDHYFWEFLAYCAGTGGSLLIIGSAAGVAVMGMENIDFIWYMKRISLLAMVGYIGGAFVYIAQEESGLLHGKHDTEYVVNIEDDVDVIRYLTNNEFIMESGSELGAAGHSEGTFLFFIHFVDEKTGDIYIGYNTKEIDNGDEQWEGQLKRSLFKTTKVSENDVRFSILERIFHLSSDGMLHEEVKSAQPGKVRLIKWEPIVEE